MSGILYIVGTPIGNLGDISPRALETLRNADFIAAEDTRVSVKLLNHFDIHTKLVSCHEHSGRAAFDGIVRRIEAGENCALITDAGMPCISDPGEEVVRLCTECGIEIKAVPGPSAAISALAVSGLDTSRFTFEGFLSVTKKQRLEHLSTAAENSYTMIFYEAPHKLKTTLADMLEYFGNRKIALCRELTKLHEEVIRTCLEDAARMYETCQPRGEYVLIVEGKKAPETKLPDIGFAASIVTRLVGDGEKLSDACKAAAKDTGLKKSDIYAEYLRITEKN